MKKLKIICDLVVELDYPADGEEREVSPAAKALGFITAMVYSSKINGFMPPGDKAIVTFKDMVIE